MTWSARGRPENLSHDLGSGGAGEFVPGQISGGAGDGQGEGDNFSHEKTGGTGEGDNSNQGDGAGAHEGWCRYFQGQVFIPKRKNAWS